MNQVMKLIHVRLFVSGRTIAEVENNAKEIMNHLESNGYKSAVFLNECQHEWQSMFYPVSVSNAEVAKIYARNGQPCTSSALAGGDPFHFTSLNDEYGSLYGTSSANGGGIGSKYRGRQAGISYGSTNLKSEYLHKYPKYRTDRYCKRCP